MSRAHLPRSIPELRELMAGFSTEEAARRGLAVTIGPEDIVISTYAKSGTTWLQQVVHQLRSGGDMGYEEISSTVPWLDVAHDMGVDPEAQPWRPRAFKLHRIWEEVPKGGRVITAFRAPEAVALSFYRFFSGSFFEEGAVSLEAFTRDWFLQGTGSGLYFDHIVSFWPQVHDPEILAFTYEDMVEAPDQLVRVVATYMGIDDEAVIATAIRHSSRDFMASHPEKFDDHVLSEAISRRTGYPIGSLGKVHARAPSIRLTDELRADIAARWRETVTPAIGFEDYAALRAAMPDPLGVRG